MYSAYNLDKSQSEIDKILKDSVLYSTEYIDSSNIIINLTELKRTIFPVQKCNKWFSEKHPIPYFENFDFGLGEKESKKIVDNETYYDYTYTVPFDLKVYVISAKSGYFWKNKCDEKRPESLKEWKNGYSRGIATSAKSNQIIYWTIVW